MKHLRTGSVRGKFRHLGESREAQVLLMTLSPGEASEEAPSNEHPRAEQWMLVLDGAGEVIPGRGRRLKIGPGSLVIIEKRERHQIRATGKTPLRTLNFYLPPAYKKGGAVRPQVK
jgi:mannose-6-phosphate isomerase-like protein (cupin superfamily)